MIISFCGHSKFEQTKEAEQKILSILDKLVSDQPAELYLGDHGEFDSFAFYCCKKFNICRHTFLYFAFFLVKIYT